MICVRRLGALAVFVFLLAVAAACGSGEAPCTSERDILRTARREWNQRNKRRIRRTRLRPGSGGSQRRGNVGEGTEYVRPVSRPYSNSRCSKGRIEPVRLARRCPVR